MAEVDGKAQAFKVIAAQTARSDQKLTPDVIRKLSDKITQLFGEDAAEGLVQERGMRGELLNEDGLPIIDINEPLASDDSRGLGDISLADEDVLVPLASLSPSEREQRQLERDRILDLLEEEEQREQESSEELSSEQRREILQKRKEAAKREMDKLKAAKEMQKKMGKALLRNISEAKEREERAQKEILIKAQDIEDQRRALRPKKSVTFAKLPEESADIGDESEKPGNIDWGDVDPARLRTSNRPTLMMETQMDRLPMKMAVVERVPSHGADPDEPAMGERDSDDESTQGDIVHSDLEDHDSNHEEGCPADTDEDTDTDEEPVLEDEVDLDFAQHQREIALDYHSKRCRIGKATSNSMSDLYKGEDDWKHPTVPLEATPSASRPKPAISHFKASRITSAYNPSSSSSASTSLGTTILPASSTRILQRAIRLGKLDCDNTLIGGDSDESASEEESGVMQKAMELLKKAEVYNFGPDGNFLRSSPPNPQRPPCPAESSALQHASTKPTGSKFKLVRSQAGWPAASVHLPPPSPTNSSRSNTPVSGVGRSSPKLPSAATVVEHHISPGRRPQLSTSNAIELSSVSPLPPVIESSQNFRSQSTFISEATATPKHLSMLVDSPSFPTNTPSIPLAVSREPTILDSPSFPQDQRSSRRPDRPPTVMSSAVRESVRGAPTRSSAPSELSEGPEAKPERKVSRFLAERL